MGAIYLGQRIADGEHVVLKQLLPEFTEDERRIDLFLREADVMASLRHPNIVRMLDLVSAGESYFMVIEFIDGGDLHALLKRARRRRQKFSIGASLYIARAVLFALDYAHNTLSASG